MIGKLTPVLSGFIVLLLAFFLISSQTTAAPSSQPQDHVPGQVLVKFKDNTPETAIDAELKKHHGQVVDQIKGIDTLVVSVPDQALDKVIKALSKNPNVEYAEANYLVTALDFPTTSPNDSNFLDKQWGLENTGQTINGQIGTQDADIDSQTAWQVTTGSSIKVAVLDTGIDQAHPDLSSKIDLQKNFTDSSTIDDLYGHGTHVGGIVAATTDNTTGIAGTCPECRLLNGKVLNDSGSGTHSWIANGIIWATDNNAKVINMSLGSSQKSTTLEKAVNYAWAHNVVVVAAAGNSGNVSKTYPGAYTNVIAVAATDNKDRKASFSSYGSWVDVAAPGANIFSTFPTHPYKLNKSLGYDYGSGTSMATPMVSATAALVWSTPNRTSNAVVRSRLETTADKITGTGNYWTYGRINAGKAVQP
jgi:thermitase